MSDAAGTLIVRKDGRVLILQKPDKTWDLPKGLVKSTESIISAARRETREETGLEPELNGDFLARTHENIKFWIFVARATGKVKLSKEHIDFDWVRTSEAIDKLASPLGEIVERLCEEKMHEEQEINSDGSVSCGVFLPLPFDLAKDFPDKRHEDTSVPHITLLYAGDLSAVDFQKFVKVVRGVCRHIQPFEANLSSYGEFRNEKKQRIPHMKPDMSVCSLLARIHGLLRRAAEDADLKIEHSYGGSSSKKVPYETKFIAHATLDYLDPNNDKTYNGPKPTGSWHVSELEVWGFEKNRIPLGRNRYNQPSGLERDPLSIHYPMAVPDVAQESLSVAELIEATLEETRDSCLACVLKHLGQAAVLMDEAKQGYPAHRWLAVGHLGEAASEALKKYPKLADEIREQRIKYIGNPNYPLPIIDLIERAKKAGGISESSGVHPLSVVARTRARRDEKAGHDVGAEYWRGWAAGSFLTAGEKTPSADDKSINRLALRARKMSKDDEKEGHADAAEYWRGWAAGSFLTAPGKVSTKSESETSLKGYETHHGAGGSIGGIPLDGSLKWLRMLKDEENKRKKLNLRRTPLGD